MSSLDIILPRFYQFFRHRTTSIFVSQSAGFVNGKVKYFKTFFHGTWTFMIFPATGAVSCRKPMVETARQMGVWRVVAKHPEKREKRIVKRTCIHFVDLFKNRRRSRHNFFSLFTLLLSLEFGA
jgi:hypothetical protein